MFVLCVGVAVLLLPVWLFCVIGKFVAQFTNSIFMYDVSWWLLLAPVWIPLALIIVAGVGGSVVLGTIFTFVSIIQN
jgi:hypothetical protein